MGHRLLPAHPDFIGMERAACWNHLVWAKPAVARQSP